MAALHFQKAFENDSQSVDVAPLATVTILHSRGCVVLARLVDIEEGVGESEGTKVNGSVVVAASV